MRFATSGARRALGASLVLIAAALMLVAGGSAARGPEASGSDELVPPQWTPFALRDGKTTVVVQLAGDPVAAVQGDAGRKLSKSEKQAIRAQLKAGQNDVRAQIEKLGGMVVADYQSAYNGLKVSIDRSKTDAIAGIANVLGVHALERMTIDNEKGVALIGAPAVWGGLPGLHGENIKVAIIDTGLDYTHANFGGPGTTAAFAAADAADTVAPTPGSFGPRFKGGIDLVGDDYNADPSDSAYQPIPHPDPNPLDCNGHGSHVAGTAAGSGVLANGSEYTGSYNATTISGNAWRIGPGVAPEADLYGIRVFGCEGSTDVTVDAIEWAVEHDMDVINMSLGSSFGGNDDPSAVASTNAAKAGVIVVTSAGNSGPNQYITGSPGTADGAISTAANDSTPGFAGATLTVTPTITGSPFSVINANGATLTPTTGPIVVLVDNPATTSDIPGFIGSGDESRGCHPSSYTFNGVAPGLGQISVARRGTCARVAKAIFAQQAGAAVAVMTNNASGFPPVEGPITSNPDTGTPYTVTIPFLGVSGNQATAGTPSANLRANGNGKSGTIVPATLTNPSFKAFASFSSGGPRNFDSHLKPDVTAPGVSIVSTGVGSGNGAATISGTSMASPHNAGASALVRQAHPSWKVEDIKAAIVNTGDPAGVADYRTSRGGTGLIQPAASTKTQVVANANGSKFEVAINYGYEELKHDFSKTKGIKLRNHGASPVTFAISQTNPGGSPHTIELSTTSVTVPAGGQAEVHVTLNVSAATAGAANGAGLSFQEVAGLITFTPSAGQNENVALRVPYYLVPRALSDVTADMPKLKSGETSGTATLTNEHGVIDGDADFYAWGIEDKKDKGKVSNDLRAIGLQSFASATATNAARKFMVFAVNTHDPWSTPSANEFDIYVDVNNDGHDDYIVIGVDDGLVRTGSSSGVLGTFVASTVPTDTGLSVVGTTSASAPTDGSTALLFLLSTQLCRGNNPDTVAVEPGTQPCLSAAAQPRLSYHAVSFDRFSDAVDEAAGPGKYNPYTPAISQGMFETLAPGGSTTVPISTNAAEWAYTPALGAMIVTLDNKGGKEEATLLEVKPK